MSGQHTQGRLVVIEHYDGSKVTSNDSDGLALVLESNPAEYVAWEGNFEQFYPTAGYIGEANVCRLAACWNACEGVTKERLESITQSLPLSLHEAERDRAQLRAELDKVRAHRDDLLRQISAVSKSLNDSEMRRMYFNDKYLAARGLLAEVNASIPADHYDPLVDRIRALLGPAGGPLALASVGDMAERLVEYAGAVGVVVTVAEGVVEVRPGRPA